MELDEQARELALNSLNGKFDWQAYLVLVAAESRIGKPMPKSDDSRISQAMNLPKERRMIELQNYLDDTVATMSELLALTDGDENELIRQSCRRISEL